MRCALNERARDLPQLVSGRKEDKRKKINSLNESAKECVEECRISKFVAAHISVMQLFRSMKYTDGVEL